MCRRYTSEKTHLMSIVDMRGTMKLLVSFAECCLFYRALLQKRPICIDISQVRKHISCQFVYVSCHSTTQKTHELNNSEDTRTQQLTRHISCQFIYVSCHYLRELASYICTDICIDICIDIHIDIYINIQI